MPIILLGIAINIFTLSALFAATVRETERRGYVVAKKTYFSEKILSLLAHLIICIIPVVPTIFIAFCRKYLINAIIEGNVADGLIYIPKEEKEEVMKILSNYTKTKEQIISSLSVIEKQYRDLTASMSPEEKEEFYLNEIKNLSLDNLLTEDEVGKGSYCKIPQ